MKVFNSSYAAMQYCSDTRSFAFAHLYHKEKVGDSGIQDCCEIYYSISGGEHFIIDEDVYDFEPGDIFFVNWQERQHLTRHISDRHERIVIFVHTDFLHKFSTRQTNLEYCFSVRGTGVSHKLSLAEEEQKRFLFFIHELSLNNDFGQEILDQAAFLKLMVYLNKLFYRNCHNEAIEVKPAGGHQAKIAHILSYIQQHLADDLSIKSLAEQFFISPSYLSVIFKKETGTTINKYITAQRIALAKLRLSEGYSVTETCELCGFKDYSNFLKAFTRSEGVSPRKYAQVSSQE